MKINDVKVGDLVYAVGPGHHAPHGPADLQIYSTSIKNIRLDGSYSANATPADLADAVVVIDLDDNRPILGFPQWTYKSYDFGIKVHRSAAAALRAFTLVTLARAAEAERARDWANAEAQWALGQTEVLP